MSVPFAQADDETMSLLGLIMKAAALPPAMDRAEQTRVLEVVTRRCCREQIEHVPDAIKFKLIDRIMHVAPHLCVRPVAEVVDTGAAAPPPQLSLMVVVDTSGSMSSTIAAVQVELKQWIDGVTTVRGGNCAYRSVTIIFFDSKLYGPFRTTDCLGVVHGSGSTRAVPALAMLRDELARAGPSHVAFLTDGEFDEKKAAYDFGMLPNVVAFALVFPAHTPANAEMDHFAYLPRVTPPGIPIISRRAQSASDIATILEDAFASTRRGGAAAVKPLLYKLICGEYVMLGEMSIFQMNKIVSDLLQHPEPDVVHKFFSHLIGMYHLMMHRSGDLLNTLRSPDMRLMWSFLQPLKKRLALVAPTEMHAATTALVLDFLASFESSVVDLRDARLAALRKTAPMNEATKSEIGELLKAFSDMKKVDDRDRIATEHERLKQQAAAAGGSVKWVRFNYRAAVPLESFICYPNNGKKDQAEIYRMMASIGVCTKEAEGAMEMVMEPRGLMLVLRLMTYRADDDAKMTLTATQATRLALGFFATQLAGTSTSGSYVCADDHVAVRALLLRLATTDHSYTIMSNVTNLAESVNNSCEWIRVVAAVARVACVRIMTQPQDGALWRKEEAEGGATAFVLDAAVLQRMEDRDAALFIARNLNTSERNARVTRAIPVRVDNWEHLILVKERREQTSDEWFDEVAAVVAVGAARVAVTNGMMLQERLTQNAREFVCRHWLGGHRLILKTGAAHPATTFGDNTTVRLAVEAWIRAAWTQYLGGESRDVPLPVVPTRGLQAEVAAFFALRAQQVPVVFMKDSLEVCPIGAILDRLPPSRAVAVCRALCGADDSFLRLPGDEQVQLAAAAAANLNGTMCSTAAAAVAASSAPPPPVAAQLAEPLEAAAVELAGRIARRMECVPLVEGVGRIRPRKVMSQADWNALEETLALRTEAERALAMPCDEDFVCPLSSEVFVEPVCFGGHMYERAWIERWLSSDVRRSSPLTRETHDASGAPLALQAPSPFFLAQLEAYRLRVKA